METNNLKIKISFILGEKEEIKTNKIFFGSLLFVFFSVGGVLIVWFFKTAWQKAKRRLKVAQQLLVPEFFLHRTTLKILLLLAMFNLSIWGWMNKEDILPIAMGKIEEEIILGAEGAVKINDLQKELVIIEKPLQKFLGSEKDPSLSLTEDRCQKNMAEKKSSELCGKYEKDKVLEKELSRLDQLDKMKGGNNSQKAKRIVAPIPYTFAMAGSRRVCNKSNDKPGKSKQNKGKHMDMECCLDPDEYPNPHCYYSPEKYGKYM